MVHGHLKDRPHPLLPLRPEGEHHDPRFFMEKFGHFMGTTLGPEWTLDQEIARLESEGNTRIISESVAFEARRFRAHGGIIIRIENPARQNTIEGVETDPVTRAIEPDLIFMNSAGDVTTAQAEFRIFLQEHLPFDMLELPAIEDSFPEIA